MSLYNFNKHAFLGLRGETKSPKILNTRFLFLSTLYTRQINFILSLLSLCKPLLLRSTFTSFYVQTLIKHNTFEIVISSFIFSPTTLCKTQQPPPLETWKIPQNFEVPRSLLSISLALSYLQPELESEKKKEERNDVRILPLFFLYLDHNPSSPFLLFLFLFAGEGVRWRSKVVKGL